MSVFLQNKLPTKALKDQTPFEVYFLRIEITQSKFGVVMSQWKYILDILEETMLDCKPVDIPIDSNVKLVLGQGESLRDPRRYRRIVR